MRITDDRGFIGFLLGAALIIALVIGVIIAFVVGLDLMHEEQSSESFFPKDAKITEIKERVRKKRAELHAAYPPDGDALGTAVSEEIPEEIPPDSRQPKSTEERLNDLDNRLKSNTR